MCPAVDINVFAGVSSYPGKQFYTRINDSFDITCKLKTVLDNSLTYLYIF